MVCLWPMPNKVDSLYSLSEMMDVELHVSLNNKPGLWIDLTQVFIFFLFLRSWQVQQFTVCHVNPHVASLVYLSVEVQSVKAALV